MISPDIGKERRFHYPAFLIDNGVKALVNVPIIGAEGRPPFGILQVDSRTPRRFTKSDVSFLGSYASLLAAAVERLRVMEDLRESMDRQQAALGTGLIGFFDWDVRAGKVTADRCFAGFYGLDPAARRACRLAHYSTSSTPKTARLSRRTSRWHCPLRLCQGVLSGRSGWRVALATGARPLRRAGRRPLRYTGTAVNVTGPELTQAALRRSNEALEARVAERTRELTAANRRLQTEAAERERTQEALRLTQRLETLVEHLLIGAALVGTSGEVILANRSFAACCRGLPFPRRTAKRGRNGLASGQTAHASRRRTIPARGH